MPDETITLPFEVRNLFAGLAIGKGLATASPSELKLELVIKDSLINVFGSGVKEIRIPRTELAAVGLKRGWFGAKIRIGVKSLRLLQDLPNCESGEVSLHIARRDRDLAARFAQLLSSP
jgi:hypothetical protein